MTIERPSILLPWVPCSKCGAIVTYEPTVAEAFLAGEEAPCPRCKGKCDWWTALVTGIEDHFSFGEAAQLAGCVTFLFKFQLPPGETVKLDLKTLGVPADVEIVHMNLTSSGGAGPLLVHSNDVHQYLYEGVFHVFGRPPKEPQPDRGNGVNAFVTWFYRRRDDTVVTHLVDAAKLYNQGRFDAVVVPANVAAEASFAPVTFRFFKRYGSTDNVKDMLKKGATYSHQLNVLLALMADVLGVPRFPDQIRGILNRLRGLRNDLAHEGTCKEQVQRDAAEHLAASIFAARYAAVLTRKLDALEPAKSSGLAG